MERDLITAAARRVADDIGALCDAHTAGIAEGAQTDLTATEHHAAVLLVLRETVPERRLRDLAMVYGDVAAFMTTAAAADSSLDRPEWWLVHDHLARRHAVWGPYEFVVADARRLEVITTPFPSEISVDRLAGMVTAAAAAELADAARWVADAIPRSIVE